ncbi:NAD(P)-dependent oxidoreductase [Catellatospora coxensis]|uniref:3-hydroxyisobutyrate dehydrogenase n=1 Tax=Catellatospora coxensis TaxID=310354 RepID=A0A8J3L2W7_9ACTN|nr:3-hydroxyisobutyrate dehydrogenase [Catellatospora coxensis]
MKIAILGLGAMGSRMARRLLATGEHHITVWNRTAEATRPMIEQGATAAPTPATAAERQDLVISMLRDDHAGRSVWLDPDIGALTAMNPGALAVDCSTVTPAFTGELAARCAQHGVDHLDAPVLGSRPQADAGALIFLVGGSSAVLRRAEPVLRQLGSAVHHMGPAGTGAQMKLLANSLFAVQVAAVAELIGALHGTNLNPARAVEVLTATPVASQAAATAATAMLGDTFPAAFPIELVGKDLGYATADAASRQATIALTRTAAHTYQQAINEGHGSDHITAVIRLFRSAQPGS